MKNFGFGLMRLPTTDPANAAAIDVEQVKKMVDLFIEKGFTYFDTAWMYCGFQSEPTVKEVLTSRHPRNKFTLATKLNAAFLIPWRAGTRFSTSSWKRPVRAISTITCSTASTEIPIPNSRSSTAFTG